MYDSELTSICDALVPVSTVTCRRRSSDPWFDQECRLKKRQVRRLERVASSCRTPESTLEWTKERRAYRSLLRNKRESFWMLKVDAEKCSPRQLWRSIDVLLGRGSVPTCDTIDAQQFHDFFDAKVGGVRSSTDGASPPSFSQSSADVQFTCFEPVTVDEVVTAVKALPDKCCALDPLPTTMLKAVIGDLAPFLTVLFNRSLSTGCVPAGDPTKSGQTNPDRQTGGVGSGEVGWRGIGWSGVEWVGVRNEVVRLEMGLDLGLGFS
jgi:hypothetical protein